MIAADTGYWYALIDQQDRFHEAAITARKGLRERLVTTWPVVVETSYLLGRTFGSDAPADWLRVVAANEFEVYDLTRTDAARVAVLMRQYENLPMDLADASLVVLAERTSDGRILSTDQRDFNAYRFKNSKPFKNLLLA